MPQEECGWASVAAVRAARRSSTETVAGSSVALAPIGPLMLDEASLGSVRWRARLEGIEGLRAGILQVFEYAFDDGLLGDEGHDRQEPATARTEQRVNFQELSQEPRPGSLARPAEGKTLVGGGVGAALRSLSSLAS